MSEWSDPEERLRRLIDISEHADLPGPPVNPQRAYLIAGRMIQEHLAHRVFYHVRDASDWSEAVDRAVELCSEWFGEDEVTEWPFRQTWITKYVKWRYLGPRQGLNPEDARQAHRDKLQKQSPRDEAQCEWPLGCEEEGKDLQVDHVWPWGRHGPSHIENLQWLCQDHNSTWKKDLLFWDNIIPFQRFDIN